MHSAPIPIVGNSASRSQYQFGTASEYSDSEGLSSGRSSPLSTFGAPLSRTSTTTSDVSRSVYPISELLSLASSAGSRSQIHHTSSSLRGTFPEIVRARVDDLSDHLEQLALTRPRPRRSRKNNNKNQEGGASSKRSSNNNRKPHHNPNHPSSNPSSVEDSSSGWKTVSAHHGHNYNHPPMSSSPPASKPKRSQHGFRPASSWMSNNNVRGSQIDAMASWR